MSYNVKVRFTKKIKLVVSLMPACLKLDGTTEQQLRSTNYIERDSRRLLDNNPKPNCLLARHKNIGIQTAIAITCFFTKADVIRRTVLRITTWVIRSILR